MAAVADRGIIRPQRGRLQKTPADLIPASTRSATENTRIKQELTSRGRPRPRIENISYKKLLVIKLKKFFSFLVCVGIIEFILIFLIGDKLIIFDKII